MNEQYKSLIQLRKATEKVNSLVAFIFSNSANDEDWKEIENTDGRYFVSSKGRVLSLCRDEPIILKAHKNHKGYFRVSINGRKELVSRLVAKAFIKNPEDKEQAHHKNHNKADNTRENLEWATPKENSQAYQISKRQKQIEEAKERQQYIE